MDFKFFIGDLLTTKESLHQYEYFMAADTRAGKEFKGLFSKPYSPIFLTVLARRLEECPGGTQLRYLCRYFGPQGYIENWFDEVELVRHPTLPVKAETKEGTETGEE